MQAWEQRKENDTRKDVAGIVLSNIVSLDMLLEVKDADDYRVEVPTGRCSLKKHWRSEKNCARHGKGPSKENEQIVLSLYYEKNLSMKDAQVMQLSQESLKFMPKRLESCSYMKISRARRSTAHILSGKQRG